MLKGTFLLESLAMAAVALLVGCSNPISITGNTTVICSNGSDAGTSSCTIARNYPNSEQNQLQNSCTNSGGSIVSACPTTGLIGCCTDSIGGFVNESCSYSGTESELRSTCGSGTWSKTP